MTGNADGTWPGKYPLRHQRRSNLAVHWSDQERLPESVAEAVTRSKSDQSRQLECSCSASEGPLGV